MGSNIKSKEDRNEALYWDLFTESGEELGRSYVPGAVEYVRKEHDIFYGAIISAGARLDELLTATGEEEDILEQFEEALRIWKDLHLKAAELYRNRKDGWRSWF